MSIIFIEPRPKQDVVIQLASGFHAIRRDCAILSKISFASKHVSACVHFCGVTNGWVDAIGHLRTLKYFHLLNVFC